MLEYICYHLTNSFIHTFWMDCEIFHSHSTFWSQVKLILIQRNSCFKLYGEKMNLTLFKMQEFIGNLRHFWVRFWLGKSLARDDWNLTIGCLRFPRLAVLPVFDSYYISLHWLVAVISIRMRNIDRRGNLIMYCILSHCIWWVSPIDQIKCHSYVM